MDNQIDWVKRALIKFVRNVHKDGADKCCNGTYNSRYNFNPFTSNANVVVDRLKNISLTDSSSCFRDSIHNFVRDFEAKSNNNFPRLIIIVSDCLNNDGIINTDECAKQIREFTHKPHSYVYIISKENYTKRLKSLFTNNANFRYKFGMSIEKVVLKVAFEFVYNITRNEVKNADQSWEVFNNQRANMCECIEYGFLIYTSGIPVPLPVNLTGTVCRKNHVMEFINDFELEWNCDECISVVSTEGVRLRCTTCDYDLCRDCMIRF